MSHARYQVVRRDPRPPMNLATHDVVDTWTGNIVSDGYWNRVLAEGLADMRNGAWERHPERVEAVQTLRDEIATVCRHLEKQGMATMLERLQGAVAAVWPEPKDGDEAISDQRPTRAGNF